MLIMQPALTLFWMFTGLSLAIGTVTTIIGLVRAPDGYEDQDGFQFAHDGEVMVEMQQRNVQAAQASQAKLA